MPGRQAMNFGWEEVPKFQYPLCLPNQTPKNDSTAAARAKPLVTRGQPTQPPGIAPFFVEEVLADGPALFVFYLFDWSST